MAEKRMDLNEAGSLLGLTPNAVRARAAKGQIRHEKDNRGKWWVYLDADTAANDRVKMEPPKPSIETSNVTSNDLKFEGENKALKAHIQTLSEALTTTRSELQALQGMAALSNDLQVRLATATAGERAAQARAEMLQTMLDTSMADYRKLVDQTVQKNPAAALTDDTMSRKGFFQTFMARLGKTPPRGS